jgi:hypothetical protein
MSGVAVLDDAGDEQTQRFENNGVFHRVFFRVLPPFWVADSANPAK